MQWWIDLFEDLVACDLLDISNESHLEIVRFCFMNIIQSDIQVFANNWNTHRIRPSSTGVASGVPNELFFLPQPPYTDCALVVRPDDVNQFRYLKLNCRKNAVEQTEAGGINKCSKEV